MPAIQLASGIVIKDEPVSRSSEEQVKQTDGSSAESVGSAEGRSTKTSSSATTRVMEDGNRSGNKSGRNWKTIRKEKASMIIYKPLKKTLGTTWEQRQAEKRKLQEAKELQEELMAKRNAKIEEEKKRLAEKRKRKAENELKNAKVQVMSRPEKIKKMSKKQLRSVYKTRMGDDGVVRLVGAYE